jgi:hypothetical protein
MNKDTSDHLAIQQERVAVIEKVLEKMEHKLKRARRLYAQECDYLDALAAMETEGAKTGTK